MFKGVIYLSSHSKAPHFDTMLWPPHPLCAAVLYPAHGALHFHGLYQTLAVHTPAGLHGLIKVRCTWDVHMGCTWDVHGMYLQCSASRHPLPNLRPQCHRTLLPFSGSTSHYSYRSSRTGHFLTASPLSPLLQVVENWTFSLFFCSAELWGSVVIAVLFWSLANDVCTMEEVRMGRQTHFFTQNTHSYPTLPGQIGIPYDRDGRQRGSRGGRDLCQGKSGAYGGLPCSHILSTFVVWDQSI